MTSQNTRRLISGVKPTGRPHIGNYFGAMRQFVDQQSNFEAFYFIADYHALNGIQNAAEMQENILGVAMDYLAVGLDPKKSVIFKQSDISAHTELAWIFDTFTTMPYLMRAHAFKDAEAKNKEISVGTFNYPILMAADILLYDADVVPVGQDQKQHIEYARDTAEKFNRIFGETFKLPEPLIIEDVAIVPGLDGQKMSKSYGNTIPLFAEEEEILKCAMGIVTDSSGDFPTNVHAIHKLFKSEEELGPLYDENKRNYKALKEALAADINAFVAPLREKRKEFESNPDAVKEMLRDGGERARAVADAKMDAVRTHIGVSL